MEIALVCIFAYLLGSIPFGVLLAKFKGVDLRQHGSGNIGATNVNRTLGKTAGILTLFGDCGKGYLAAWVAGQLLEAQWGVAVAGLMAFLGHVFSIFLKFKGGKGVATGLGVFLYLIPGAGLSSIGVFAVSLAFTRYVSVSSILAAISIPWLGIYFQAPGPSIYVATAAAIITAIRHHENIQRLVDGTESKFMKK
jgi:acyl phosphate:glycerol-3-phosphate acyltransferase